MIDDDEIEIPVSSTSSSGPAAVVAAMDAAEKSTTGVTDAATSSHDSASGANAPAAAASAATAAVVSASTVASSVEPLSRQRLKKPSNSAFKQQRLNAWQPILTAGTVLPIFFLIGIAFIPIGVALMYMSNSTVERVFDYTTDCRNEQNQSCADLLSPKGQAASANSGPISCNCTMPVHLDVPIYKDVYMFYSLKNFYQNHRQYVKSRDDNQLLGILNRTPSSECKDFRFVDHGNGTKSPIVPCGMIANSMFSDRLELLSLDRNMPVPLLRTGIAWKSDKERKFRNPPGDNLREAFRGFVKPPNWPVPLWELDLENPDNNGLQNEDLIVWMRTASLPNFRKLYRRIDHSKAPFQDSLPAGRYLLKVQYNFDTKPFYGRKRIILSNTSFLGGKNSFLATSYLVVGCVCLLLGIVLLFVHVRYGRKQSDVLHITPATSYH